MTLAQKSLIGVIAFFLLLTAAFGADVGAQEEKAENFNPIYNEYSRFIAGLATPGSSLATLERDPAWIKYADAINRSWESFEARQLEPMRRWVSQELPTAGTVTAFYPFSGPDILNLSTMFPQAGTYILVALEPPGTLPDLAGKNLPGFFSDLQTSLRDYLYIDYFGTDRMARQISNSELQGVLPVILFFLAREQARILDIRYLALKGDGALEEAPALKGGNPGAGIPGLRIDFQAASSRGTKTVYYFRLNLQNSSWGQNPQFEGFLKSFGPLTTFTKSASYLLFSPYTSCLEHFILERSIFVLQDDSGVPLHDFDHAFWDLKFYGTYTRPISLFSYRYQKDLAAVYNKGVNVYPLPFGIGYQFRPGTSNLFFASKKPGELPR